MRLQELIEIVKSDIGYTKKNLFLKFIKKILLSNTFKLVLNYRIGNYFYKKRNSIICQFLKHRQIKRYSCQISYKATIGRSIQFPHPIGIVIGDEVVIGDDVKIWQHVTLGSHGKKEKELKYPLIGDNVRIYAGSMIIGGVNVGKNSTIGGMSMVLSDVEEGRIVAGIPAKVVN